jgi:hypothetical protein
MELGAGEFTHGNWTLGSGENIPTVSEHERCHRKLNDITSYGALLDAVARLKQIESDAERFARLSRRLVSSSRITHEVFATYFSNFADIDATTPLPSALLGNEEYLGYFGIGAHFVGLAPNRRLGSLILSAVIRIAMNGPLPDAVTNGEFGRLLPRDFKTGDEPDRRLLMLRKIITHKVCNQAIAAAYQHFGGDERWFLFIDRPDGMFAPADFIKITPFEGIALIEPGGVPIEFENAVNNCIIDFLAAHAEKHGIQIYTLVERQAIEKRIREAIGQRSERFYDNPSGWNEFGHRRDIGREKIVLRAPIPTYLWRPGHLSTMDWAYFRAIHEKEGHCPLYIRTVDDFLMNHQIVENPNGIELRPGELICFLRKKRRLPDGEIVLDVVVHEAPKEILKSALYICSLKEYAGIRACVSGKLLTEPYDAVLAPWVSALDYVNAPLSFSIDTHPQRMIDALHQTEALAWEMFPIEEGSELYFLAIYPVGASELPSFAVFRVGTMTTIDAILKLINPSPIAASFRRMGIVIHGLSEAAQEKEWPVPDHLAWTLSRYAQEEALVLPQTPEEMSNDK